MANVLTTTQPTGQQFQVTRLDGGSLDIAIADETSLPAGPVNGFRATFYVDPLFVGTSTGSASNPYPSIAAALAAATALALATALFIVPPVCTIAENIVLPVAGSWEIVSQQESIIGAPPANLTGTLTLTNTGNASYAFRNVQLSGNIGGNASATSRILFYNCRVLSPVVALTASGGASLRAVFQGIGPGASGVLGTANGAISVAGSIVGNGVRFLGPVALSAGLGSIFQSCSFDVGVAAIAGAGAVQVTLRECYTNGPVPAFTANAGSTLQVLLDGSTAADFMRVGVSIAGTVTFTTLEANTADQRTLNDNLGATALGHVYPVNTLMVAEGCLTLQTPGTAGAAVLNITYTDINNVVRTKAVTSALNIAGAAGDEAHGSVPFQTNGGSNPTFSVTGVVTPGALVMASAIGLRAAS